MATIQGPDGAVSLPTGFSMKAMAWSADLIIETTDTTGFADAGYRVRTAVMLSMDGTVTGAAEGGSSTPAPGALIAAPPVFSNAEGIITLTAEAGNLYTFTAVINNISFNRPVAGHMEMVVSFQSTGAITQTWA